jgi:hypothetical protein
MLPRRLSSGDWVIGELVTTERFATLLRKDLFSEALCELRGRCAKHGLLTWCKLSVAAAVHDYAVCF